MQNSIRLTIIICLSGLLFSWAIYSPNSLASSKWSRSYLLEQQGEYEQAIDLMKTLTTQSEASEFAFIRLGWLNYLNGDYSESISHYKKALTFKPKAIDVQVGLLSPLAAQFRWKEVAYTSSQILQVAPWSYQAHLFLMQSRSNLKQWTRLKKQAKKLLKKYPTKFEPWVFLARSYLYEGNSKEARFAYQQVLYRYPANTEANAYINKK